MKRASGQSMSADLLNGESTGICEFGFEPIEIPHEVFSVDQGAGEGMRPLAEVHSRVDSFKSENNSLYAV